ncbi:MAG: hypothetical protein JSR46_04495, partial [Verrucomicrobia bacterium]|nr:hypothetical protein [Verrucomicrobiota bacterium]
MNIKKLSILFCATACSFFGLAADSVKSTEVKVQLFRDYEGALVEVKGAYNVFDPKNGTKLIASYLPSSYYMYPTTDGLKWGQEFPDVYQLLIAADKKETTIVVAGTEYRGKAYFYQIQGSIGAVNELPLDDFVMSTLSTHIPEEIVSQDALEALAIALRTEV